MTKRNRDLARRGTGAFTSGSGQVTRPAGPVALARGGTVFHRVVPAHLACRIGARGRPRPLLTVVTLLVSRVGLVAPKDRAAHSRWLRPSRPPDHSRCWAGPARPSTLRQPAPPIWPASGARRCRHRRKA